MTNVDGHVITRFAAVDPRWSTVVYQSDRRYVRRPGVNGRMEPSSTTWTVGLSVAHDRNRELLVSHLSAAYEVVTTAPEPSPDGATPSVDLWVVDARSFERRRDALRAAKAEARPVFLPVLLLAPPDTADRLLSTDDSVVDEFHTTPVRRQALSYRVENLLERRYLSLDLDARRQRNYERFRTLFEATPDPVVVTDDEGTLTELNAACLRRFGVERSITGESVAALVPDAPPVVTDLFTRDDDGTWTETVTWDTRDEARLVTEIHVGRSGPDPTSDRVGVLRDVTERHERLERLERQNERLQSFASTISHDFRNPLNVAQGHVKRLDDDGKSLEYVTEALDRMEELVEEVFTLATNGRVVLDPVPVSLDAVAAEAWTHVATKDATLVVEDDCTVEADPERLVTVFENLVRNAVQHGGSDVTVRVGTLDDADGFYVADDGPGIPPEDRETVFDTGYTDHAQGTGFGLSIVSQVVEAHDWQVDVTESGAGGARFEISGVVCADAVPDDGNGTETL